MVALPHVTGNGTFTFKGGGEVQEARNSCVLACPFQFLFQKKGGDVVIWVEYGTGLEIFLKL